MSNISADVFTCSGEVARCLIISAFKHCRTAQFCSVVVFGLKLIHGGIPTCEKKNNSTGGNGQHRLLKWRDLAGGMMCFALHSSSS
jgi:hypothetical protein